MKITTVIGRGTKKDFIDIATLLETYTLKQLLSLYEAKYPNASSFMAIKSLSYFEDAEMQPMPYMFCPLSWEEAKTKVLHAIQEIGHHKKTAGTITSKKKGCSIDLSLRTGLRTV